MIGPPEVIVFDLGGVVVDFQGAEGMRAMTAGAHDLDFCREHWHRLPELDLFERGAVSPALFADAFIREWRLGLDRAQFIDGFRRWVRGHVDGAPELLRSLKGRYRLACLSNLNEVHWERCVELGTPSLFDAHFLSFEMGVRKPEPEIYARVAAALGIAPSAISFFDDLRANVDAARRAGMRGFLVEGSDVRAALAAAGIIESPPFVAG